jgi:hypothetical protein
LNRRNYLKSLQISPVGSLAAGLQFIILNRWKPGTGAGLGRQTPMMQPNRFIILNDSPSVNRDGIYIEKEPGPRHKKIVV